MISRTFSKPTLDGTVQVIATDEVLRAISKRVLTDREAYNALVEGYRRNAESMAFGDISSPEPSKEYLVIYSIMNDFDPYFAGAMGSSIIQYLERTLLGCEQTGH